MNSKTIAAADAVKAFGKQDIQVQEAKAVKVKGADDKERPGFKTEMKPLAEKHVMAARKYEDGRIAITTIDGRRYEVGGAA